MKINLYEKLVNLPAYLTCAVQNIGKFGQGKQLASEWVRSEIF